MHLDRAHQHDARDAGAARSGGQRGGGRRFRLDSLAGLGRGALGAAREMHDRAGLAESAGQSVSAPSVPAARTTIVSGATGVAHRRDDALAAPAEAPDQGAADEAAGAGDDDGREILQGGPPARRTIPARRAMSSGPRR